MSKLYYTESGHGIPTMGEEITTFRRARKVLYLETTSSSAVLYVLARSYPGATTPMRIKVNGREIKATVPYPRDAYRWYQIEIKPELLKFGENIFEFWSDSTAMNSWSLGLEAGHAEPESYISDDTGITWRNSHMGYLNVFRGEYIVRLRLSEGEDPKPPTFVWELPTNPKLESLRRLIPPQAKKKGDILDRVRALTFWLASSWEHANTAVAMQFAPWDAETVLEWGAEQRGHNGQRPVVHCVHFSSTFVSCCQAVGIPARGSVFTNEQPDGWFGHFAAEIWSEEHGKWIMVDPQIDALFMRDGVPMSVNEVQDVRLDLANYTQFGPGTNEQRKNPRLCDFMEVGYPVGRSFKHRAVWYRSDLLTRPEYSPPAHGATAYCEIGLVWEKREKPLFGMFPYHGAPEYFDDPPNFDNYS